MYILFDIGGTNMRLSSSIDGEKIGEPIYLSTPRLFSEGKELLIDAIQQLVQGREIHGIAGGIAGPLDKSKSHLLNAPNLQDWIEKPLRSELEKHFSVPVFLENDAALAGLGEAHFGDARHKSIVAYLTVSTGVGGVRIVKGRIDDNASGFEPGHQMLSPDGPLCIGCRRKGHLEALIGGASLAKRFEKRPEDIHDQKVWEEISYWLALGLNNTLVFWSPDIVVLGGSLMEKIEIERVRSYLQEWCQIYPQLPPLTKSTLKDNGLYGALALVKLHTTQPLK